MDSAKAINPMSTSTKLDMDINGEYFDQKTYRGMIGSLLYITITRLDIMFSIGLYARFQSNPKQSHLKVVKRIFRYLKGTPSLGLWYPNSKNIELLTYIEADFASCQIDRKGISGTCQLLCHKQICLLIF